MAPRPARPCPRAAAPSLESGAQSRRRSGGRSCSSTRTQARAPRPAGRGRSSPVAPILHGTTLGRKETALRCAHKVGMRPPIPPRMRGDTLAGTHADLCYRNHAVGRHTLDHLGHHTGLAGSCRAGDTDAKRHVGLSATARQPLLRKHRLWHWRPARDGDAGRKRGDEGQHLGCCPRRTGPGECHSSRARALESAAAAQIGDCAEAARRRTWTHRDNKHMLKPRTF